MENQTNVAERQFPRSELEERFSYHPPTGLAPNLHEQVREEIKYIAGQINELIPDGREKAIVFTKLEEVGFFAHAAIARNRGLHDDAPSDQPQG